MAKLLMVGRASKRGAGAAGLAGIAAAGLTTTVLACSSIMGALTLTPDSAPAGTVISTTATGLKPYPATYDLFFGGTCMTFTGKLLKTITTNSQGGWTDVKVTIPRKATLGSHSLCGVELTPVRGQSATSHDSFTVV